MTAPAVGALVDGTRATRLGQGYGPYVVFLVLTAAVIPWRSKTYFEGDVDAVVVAKATLSVVALALAALVVLNRGHRQVAAAPLVFLAFYLTCTVLGGWSAGNLGPSAVVAVRVALLALIVTILAQRFDGEQLLACLIGALGTYAAVGAATGLGNLADGRLSGRYPQLHPNELGSICALVVLWCVWKVISGRDTWAHLLGVGLAVAALLGTGSRAAMGALAVAGIVLICSTHALRLRTVVLGLIAVPIGFWLLTGTELLASLVFRGGQIASALTLSNRTIAWQAALAPKDSAWTAWLGGGLTMKRIEVAGQYWNEQIFDSSWISALVQGGFIGLGLCALLVLHSFGRLASSPRPLRGLQFALVTYLALRGFLESGLFDATPSFLVLLTTVLATPVRPLADGAPSLSGRPGVARAGAVVH